MRNTNIYWYTHFPIIAPFLPMWIMSSETVRQSSLRMPGYHRTDEFCWTSLYLAVFVAGGNIINNSMALVL
jgi:hypothetical protein